MVPIDRGGELMHIPPFQGLKYYPPSLGVGYPSPARPKAAVVLIHLPYLELGGSGAE